MKSAVLGFATLALVLGGCTSDDPAATATQLPLLAYDMDSGEALGLIGTYSTDRVWVLAGLRDRAAQLARERGSESQDLILMDGLGNESVISMATGMGSPPSFMVGTGDIGGLCIMDIATQERWTISYVLIGDTSDIEWANEEFIPSSLAEIDSTTEFCDVFEC